MWIATLAFILALLAYGPYYYPSHASGLTLDYSYKDLDEFKVVFWLKGVDGYASSCTRESFHENQWSPVSSPCLKRTSSPG